MTSSLSSSFIMFRRQRKQPRVCCRHQQQKQQSKQIILVLLLVTVVLLVESYNNNVQKTCCLASFVGTKLATTTTTNRPTPTNPGTTCYSRSIVATRHFDSPIQSTTTTNGRTSTTTKLQLFRRHAVIFQTNKNKQYRIGQQLATKISKFPISLVSKISSSSSSSSSLFSTNDSSSITPTTTNNDNDNTRQTQKPSKRGDFFETIASFISQRWNTKQVYPMYYEVRNEKERKKTLLVTLLRVGIPSIFAGVIATLLFPGLSLLLATYITQPGVFTVLSQDSSQFVQNFLSVASLLFSILVGQTYYFLYTQQESIYYALFDEVTEAKSLLEQVALVCQGRAMYGRCLESIRRYVEQDLRQVQADPAVLLSARPMDDPLESIMYMTSVGVPSTVYETVKSLREARARRLGALQRKLPSIHMLLLWILAAIELVSFPLLGAGTQSIGGYKLLTVEGLLFGIMTFGIVLTLRVVGELWRPAGGSYNVDAVLSVMVSGLEEELKARMAGKKVFRTSQTLGPSSASYDKQQFQQEQQQQQQLSTTSSLSSSEIVDESNTTATTIQTQG